MKPILDFALDDSGATTVEYGLIASLIAIVVIGAAGALGAKLKGTFNHIAANLS